MAGIFHVAAGCYKPTLRGQDEGPKAPSACGQGHLHPCPEVQGKQPHAPASLCPASRSRGTVACLTCGELSLASSCRVPRGSPCPVKCSAFTAQARLSALKRLKRRTKARPFSFKECPKGPKLYMQTGCVAWPRSAFRTAVVASSLRASVPTVGPLAEGLATQVLRAMGVGALGAHLAPAGLPVPAGHLLEPRDHEGQGLVGRLAQRRILGILIKGEEGRSSGRLVVDLGL